MRTNSDSFTADTFMLHGKQYSVAKIISNANAGPSISAKVEELDLKTNHVLEQSNPQGALAYKGPFVFYQYEGKFVILIGFDNISGMLIDAQDDTRQITHFKGKLLTRHSLKRCLVDENPQQTAQIINEQLRDSGSAPRYENKYQGDKPREDVRRFNNPTKPTFRDRTPRY